VPAHRVLAQHQPRGDAGVAQSLCDQREHVTFAQRPGRRVRGRGQSASCSSRWSRFPGLHTRHSDATWAVTRHCANDLESPWSPPEPHAARLQAERPHLHALAGQYREARNRTDQAGTRAGPHGNLTTQRDRNKALIRRCGEDTGARRLAPRFGG
jgi:hypothetical protein